MPAPFDKVGPPISPLGCGPDHMGEAQLGHDMIYACLRRPITKAASQPMRHRRAPGSSVQITRPARFQIGLVHPPHHRRNRHVRQHAPSRGEEDVGTAVHSWQSPQKIHRSRRKGYLAFPARLHPLGRDRPERLVQFDLVPSRASDFARPRAGHRHELKRPRCQPVSRRSHEGARASLDPGLRLREKQVYLPYLLDKFLGFRHALLLKAQPWIVGLIRLALRMSPLVRGKSSGERKARRHRPRAALRPTVGAAMQRPRSCGPCGPAGWKRTDGQPGRTGPRSGLQEPMRDITTGTSAIVSNAFRIMPRLAKAPVTSEI